MDEERFERIMMLLRKHSGSLSQQAYFNILGALSADLPRQYKKVWTLNVGKGGAGKGRVSGELLGDLGLFDNFRRSTDTSPEGLQDDVCYRFKDNQVLFIPEFGEDCRRDIKYIKLFKNLYDGHIVKDTKSFSIEYFFNSALNAGINKFYIDPDMEAVYDRCQVLMCEIVAANVVERIRAGLPQLDDDDIECLKGYVDEAREIIKVNSFDIDDNQLWIDATCRMYERCSFDSYRPLIRARSLLTCHCALMGQDYFDEDDVQFIVNFVIINSNMVHNFMYKRKKRNEWIQMLTTGLKNTIFIQKEQATKAEIAKAIRSFMPYTKSYAERKVQDLIKEDVLELMIVKKRYFYQLKNVVR